jgi:hypothetical protein
MLHDGDDPDAEKAGKRHTVPTVADSGRRSGKRREPPTRRRRSARRGAPTGQPWPGSACHFPKSSARPLHVRKGKELRRLLIWLSSKVSALLRAVHPGHSVQSTSENDSCVGGFPQHGDRPDFGHIPRLFI